MSTITVRAAADRGHTKISWLDSWHTFSFGDYIDRRHTGFRTLRVINEDTIAPGGGFAPHRHRDMEILTYVYEGALAHRDSIGNSDVIRAGDVQRMSAGSGIEHSEYNASQTARVRLLQIWIIPAVTGISPGYEQMTIPAEEKTNRWRRIADDISGNGVMTIHQDASIHTAVITAGATLIYATSAGRGLWLQVVIGTLTINGVTAISGDGVAITATHTLTVHAVERSEVLLFDLA